MLKVQLALRDGFGRHNMSSDVFLKSFSVSKLHVVGVHARHFILCHGGLL